MVVSHKPHETMSALAESYDLKDTVKPPEKYLGANIIRYRLPDGDGECWAMSGKDYVKHAVALLKEILEKTGRSLPTGKKAERPYPENYRPETDTSPELRDEEASRYQQLIGILRWAVELGRIDIKYEVTCLSSFLVMPRAGHLEAVYNIFGYLSKHVDSVLALCPRLPELDGHAFKDGNWKDSIYGDNPDPLPPNAPKPSGFGVTVPCFWDANHAGDLVTRRSHTGIIIFVNMATVIWYSKKQNTFESSTYGSKFVAARVAVDLIVALRYKLQMFGIPIIGPCNLMIDNNSVVGS
jgi:hypothetical protein